MTPWEHPVSVHSVFMLSFQFLFLCRQLLAVLLEFGVFNRAVIIELIVYPVSEPYQFSNEPFHSTQKPAIPFGVGR